LNYLNNLKVDFTYFYSDLVFMFCNLSFWTSFNLYLTFNWFYSILTFELKTAEFASYIGGLISIWLGFSLFDLYHAAEMITLFIYRRRESQRIMSGLSVISEPLPAIEAYDPTKSHRQYNIKSRRDHSKRRAKAPINFQTISRSPHYESNYS